MNSDCDDQGVSQGSSPLRRGEDGASQVGDDWRQIGDDNHLIIDGLWWSVQRWGILPSDAIVLVLSVLELLGSNPFPSLNLVFDVLKWDFYLKSTKKTKLKAKDVK